MPETPLAQKLLLENAWVRVWEMIVRPGESYPFHVHQQPYLSIVLKPASLVLVDEDSSERRMTVRAGEVIWQEPPEAHAVRNVGRTTFQNRLVELLRYGDPAPRRSRRRWRLPRSVSPNPALGVKGASVEKSVRPPAPVHGSDASPTKVPREQG